MLPTFRGSFARPATMAWPYGSSRCSIVIVLHDYCLLPSIPPCEKDDHLPGLHKGNTRARKPRVSPRIYAGLIMGNINRKRGSFHPCRCLHRLPGARLLSEYSETPRLDAAYASRMPIKLLKKIQHEAALAQLSCMHDVPQPSQMGCSISSHSTWQALAYLQELHHRGPLRSDAAFTAACTCCRRAHTGPPQRDLPCQ